MLMLNLFASLAVSVQAVPQTAPPAGPQASSQPAAAAAAPAYSTKSTTLGDLLDNPDTKAVLDKHIEAMVNSDQIGMARGMTLDTLAQYAGGTLTPEVLAAIDADLAKVPPKP